MLHWVLTGLGILVALSGLTTISKKQLKLSGTKKLEGDAAKKAGVVILVVGLAVVVFAWVGVPVVMKLMGSH